MSETPRFLKSVGSVDNVGSRTELERFLDDVKFAKDASTERLRNLSAAVQANRRVSELANAQSKLVASAPAASAASVLLSSASHTTSDVRTKIDDVLLVYERCREAKSIVDQVIELRDCLQGCHTAMDVRDWERAAILASRARAVPKEIASSEFALKMVPYTELPDPPLVTLQAACEDLAQLFLREFNKAAQAKQMDSLSFYFKLFPLVGKNELGLDAYAQFIGKTVAGMARNVLQTATSKTRQNMTFYSAVLTNLFENIAAMIKQHTPIVKRHYGQHAMAQGVMPAVQVQVDKQAGLIIDTFWDERRMETLLNSVRAYAYPGLANAFVSSSTGGNADSANGNRDMEDSVEDLQEASARLNEIGTMLNRWRLYTTFITSGETEQFPYTKLNEAIKNGGTTENINTLLGPTFSALVLFVFRRTVERAVRMDELPTKQAISAHAVFSVESPLVSSLVDDVMYVFSQVLLQIVETGHMTTITSSLLGLRRVLDSDLIGTLQRKLQSSSPQDLASRSEFGGAGIFMVYLNDLELFIQYVGEAVDRSSATSKDPQLVQQLHQMKVGFTNLATELLADGVRNLAAKRFVPQARQLVTTYFKLANYSMPAAETPTSSSRHAFVQAWRQLMAPLRQLLHPNVVIRVLEVVSRSLGADLEKFVWSLQSRLTEAGALLLDKDLNQAISAFSELRYSLRRRFAKVAQMTSSLVDETADVDQLSSDEQTKVAQMRRSLRKM